MELNLDRRLERHSIERTCDDCGQDFTPLGRERICGFCRPQARDVGRNHWRPLEVVVD